MKRILLAALTASLLSMTPAPAHAEDTRPCVSAIERNGAKFDQSRASLERRWEVEGMGVTTVDMFFGRIVAYPACGFRPSDAYTAVKYNKDREPVFFALVKVPGAQPVGPK